MLNKLAQLKSSVYAETVSHLRLLIIKKENILAYFSSLYRIILIVLYAVLFLPHAFVVVKDLGLITSYEVDPGSIVHSILSLFQNSYNMNAAYHSKYYGWTYYSINYFLLIPIHLAKALKIVTDDYYFFVGIRFILFMIGLASVLAYLEVAKRTLKHAFLSFTAALLYIASPIVSRFFYFLHPETTGMLFLFLGILCLLRYNEGQAEDYRWYTFGLLALVLSVLSKHVFLFTAIPVIFLFIYFYCHHHNSSVFSFLISKQFVTALLATILFSVLIFFLINPFAFFQPQTFIKNQVNFFSGHTHSSLTSSEAFRKWREIIKASPVIFISLILSPLTLLGAAILGQDQKTGKTLYIVNIIGSIFFVAIISVSSRLIIFDGYLAPIYPFFILNLISIPLYIFRKSNVGFIRFSVILSLIYVLFFLLVGGFSVSIPAAYTRLMYKDSVVYKSYNYIEEQIPSGSKIAHDRFVAIPSDKGITACHYWQGCGTDYIEKFQPDYVIFSEDQKFNGETPLQTLRLIKYVNDHHFLLIDTINGANSDALGDRNITINVWKHVDN